MNPALFYINRRACNYCTGCDTGSHCVSPLRHYKARGTFMVDGIAYDPQGGDLCRRPMITVVRDCYCLPDEDDRCDCPGYFPQIHSDPPTEHELDCWTADTWNHPVLPQVLR